MSRISHLLLSTLLLQCALALLQKPLGTAEERVVKLQSSLPSNDFLHDSTRGISVAKRVVALQDLIIDNGGCNPNLCFGLDGSKLINEYDYELQREFVQLVAATVAVDHRVKMSAYQYGLRLQRISSFTRDIDQFLLDMESSKRNLALTRSFLAPALFKCTLDLSNSFEDANKIVIIGDGRTNYGSANQSIRVAASFLPPNGNGRICAVYVRNPKYRFLEEITQDPAMVIDVIDYTKFDEILEQLVRDICQIA